MDLHVLVRLVINHPCSKTRDVMGRNRTDALGGEISWSGFDGRALLNSGNTVDGYK